jgi:uncharacterized protein
MKTWVRNLLELQTADLRTKRMNKRLKEIPYEKKEVLDSLGLEKDRVTKAKEQIKTTEVEIRNVKSKVLEIQAKIENLQSKSAMVKKNDEYKALMNEIASQKSFISGLETKELKYYEQLDSDKKELESAEKSLRNMEVEAEESVEELDEMAISLKAEMEKALKNRKELFKKVDSTILPMYSRLIKKDGEPLTKIHNSTCGCCHLKLTPQTITDSKKGQMTSCDTCGHLIYYPDSE